MPSRLSLCNRGLPPAPAKAGAYGNPLRRLFLRLRQLLRRRNRGADLLTRHRLIFHARRLAIARGAEAGLFEALGARGLHADTDLAIRYPEIAHVVAFFRQG